MSRADLKKDAVVQVGNPNKMIYHPVEAPGGKQFSMEEAKKLLSEKNSWVDSPAKMGDAAASEVETGQPGAETLTSVPVISKDEFLKKVGDNTIKQRCVELVFKDGLNQSSLARLVLGEGEHEASDLAKNKKVNKKDFEEFTTEYKELLVLQNKDLFVKQEKVQI